MTSKIEDYECMISSCADAESVATLWSLSHSSFSGGDRERFDLACKAKFKTFQPAEETQEQQ